MHRSVRRGPHGTADSLARRRGRYLRSVARVQRELWVLVAAAMVADIALTLYGRQIGLVERNPVARLALRSTGASGLLGLKGVALALGVCCWWLSPSRYAPLVPLGLAAPTAFAVVSNATLVTIVLL